VHLAGERAVGFFAYLNALPLRPRGAGARGRSFWAIAILDATPLIAQNG
jgi:hypothetical protein